MGAGASSGSNVATSRSEHGGELNEEAPKTSQQAIEEIEQLKRQVKSLEAKISRLTIAQLEAQGRRTEGPVRELTMAKSEAEASVLSSGNEVG